MELYGKTFIKRGVDRQIYGAKEGRDAIVRSINTSNRSAIVHIDGTDEDVYCAWPEGRSSKPTYLRYGSSVRIAHPKGNPNTFVIIGEGVSIPTPVGSGAILPTQPATSDTVISGCGVTVGTGLTLDVAAGVYRVNNTSYALAADSVTLGSAPASPNFRIDMLSVGADGTIDVTAGTAHATAPTAPTRASDHAFIKYIMVPYGTTQLDQALHIGKTAHPALFGLSFSMSDVSMVWADTTSTGTISLTDQYSKPISGNYSFVAAISYGNGSLQHDSDASSTSSISWTQNAVSSDTFVYTRGGYDSVYTGGDPDESPIIKVYLSNNVSLYAEAAIELFDSLGDYMPINL